MFVNKAGGWGRGSANDSRAWAWPFQTEGKPSSDTPPGVPFLSCWPELVTWPCLAAEGRERRISLFRRLDWRLTKQRTMQDVLSSQHHQRAATSLLAGKQGVTRILWLLPSVALLCKLDSSWFQGSDTSSGYFQAQGLSVRLQREIKEPGSCVRVRPCWMVQIRPSPYYFNSSSGDMVAIPHRQPFRTGHLWTPVLGLSRHGD